ncbi:meiosis-specific protein MEI4 isoform X1 [Synchiropus splendidus]|uniref:meiosis-specific protein MEI4 isoform X1 n=1 Tax=Synchiropus splendidus TaxID=270530 RepID=UPI00237D5C8B|nr:meiosis-specific protein MEI4 isoform X1 [Synchiropus splendidus]
MEDRGAHVHVTPASEHAGQLLLWSRVAVAAAILKSSAAGASGREQAETLAGQLQKQDQSWRQQAEELQLEVLRLRQEVVRIQSGSSWAGLTGGADPEGGARAPNPPSGPHSLQLYDSDQSMTQDLELPDLQPQHVTQNLPSPPADPRQRVFLPHFHFLQALSSLKRLSRSEGARDSWWLEPDGGSLLVETVVQLLDAVVLVTQDSVLRTPSDLILVACQDSVKTLDLLCCRLLQSEDLRKRVQDVLQQLTSTLLDTDHSSQLEAAEVLVQCLTVLGRSSMAGSFLIRHLLSQVSAVANRLWRMLQDASDLDTFPADQYQNSCYLFQVLEQLLQSPKLRHLGRTGPELPQFLRHLEHRVFWMSEEFPLFSLYMWRMRLWLTCGDRAFQEEAAHISGAVTSAGCGGDRI